MAWSNTILIIAALLTIIVFLLYQLVSLNQEVRAANANSDMEVDCR